MGKKKNSLKINPSMQTLDFLSKQQQNLTKNKLITIEEPDDKIKSRNKFNSGARHNSVVMTRTVK